MLLLAAWHVTQPWSEKQTKKQKQNKNKQTNKNKNKKTKKKKKKTFGMKYACKQNGDQCFAPNLKTENTFSSFHLEYFVLL